jgi:hypothetical protein
VKDVKAIFRIIYSSMAVLVSCAGVMAGASSVSSKPDAVATFAQGANADFQALHA